MALVAGGAAKAWGANTNGKLGDGSTVARKTPISVVGLSGVTAVGAGTNHSLSRSSDGIAKAWGLNTDGQLGDATNVARTTPVPVSGFSASTDATYGYRGDGLRMAKTVATAPTTFAWDESGGLPMLLSETTPTGTTRYVRVLCSRDYPRLAP